MKTIILSLSLLLILFSYTKAQLLPQDCSESGILMNHTPECNDHDFVLVFEDNFDGNSLDLTKWWTPTGVTRNFNLIDVKVWYKPENVTVNNGTLKIKADKLSSPEVHTFLTDQNTTTTAVFSYTSGELKTFQKFYHGKFEIRCKLPAGQGLFPAFWTHDGLNQSEIDIFDNKQNVEQLIMATGFDFDEDGSANGCGDIVGDSPFETIPDLTDWHVYTCIFDNDFIEWQVDGVPYFSYARFHNSSGDALYCGDEFELGQYFQKKAYPLDKMIMIMNLAVLNGEDMPDETTIFPAFYEVDYVRFYKRTPCDGCVNNIVYENIENLPSATRTQE